MLDLNKGEENDSISQANLDLQTHHGEDMITKYSAFACRVHSFFKIGPDEKREPFAYRGSPSHGLAWL